MASKVGNNPLISKTFAELEKANGAFRVEVRDFAEAPVAERASPAVVVVVVVVVVVTPSSHRR